MVGLVVWAVFFLAFAAVTFDPLEHGPSCGESLTHEEEHLLDEDPEE